MIKLNDRFWALLIGISFTVVIFVMSFHQIMFTAWRIQSFDGTEYQLIYRIYHVSFYLVIIIGLLFSIVLLTHDIMLKIKIHLISLISLFIYIVFMFLRWKILDPVDSVFLWYSFSVLQPIVLIVFILKFPWKNEFWIGSISIIIYSFFNALESFIPSGLYASIFSPILASGSILTFLIAVIIYDVHFLKKVD